MDYTYIYMVGIGGIGMSAVARYFNHQGLKVSGYDRTPSEITDALQREGIDVHFDEDTSFIPKDREHTLAIYTPAIPADSIELTYLRDNGYRLLKRSRILGEISGGKRCLAISGTHGKSTTSTMLGHIFQDSGTGCSAFLGAIAKNYGTNLLLSKGDAFVAEADEFDRSFLQLHPEIAVITAVDPDHLDIYGDLGHIREAFSDFAAQVTGHLVVKKGVEVDLSRTKAKVWTYSSVDDADFRAEGLSRDGRGYFHFTIVHPKGRIEGCTVGIPGRINVENAVAAAACALLYGIDPQKIREALASFRGVRRRLDIQVDLPGSAYVDDYAHHPKEIEAAIASIRDMFPSRKLTAVFQPHLYTRTRDFAEGFAEALSKADQVVLLNIYPAREEPIEGVTSRLIFDRITLSDKKLIDRSELMDTLAGMDTDVLVTFGAGDIDRFVHSIAQMKGQRR